MGKEPIFYPLAVPFAARGRSLLATNFETVGEGSATDFVRIVRVGLLDQNPAAIHPL